jgi:hypothetical protein
MMTERTALAATAKRRNTKCKEIREWTTTVAVVIGVCVGIYQWWLKEVLFPANAPVNVTTDVNVKEAGWRITKAPGESLRR